MRGEDSFSRCPDNVVLDVLKGGHSFVNVMSASGRLSTGKLYNNGKQTEGRSGWRRPVASRPARHSGIHEKCIPRSRMPVDATPRRSL